MTVTAGRYVPLFSSERTVDKPWIGCGVVSYEHLVALATLGESQVQANGRASDQGDLTDRLRVGLRAFHARPDSNGIPDRDDADRIKDAMFPWLKQDMIPLVSRDFDEVVEWLRADNAVSIALFLGAVPGATVSKYTDAPHQVTLYDRDGEVKKGKVTDLDGMHPPMVKWGGFQVPLLQVEKAAKSFPGPDHGLVLAWRAPLGGWTQAALVADGFKDRIASLRGDLGALESQVANKTSTISELKERIDALEAGGPAPDCGVKVAAALDSERVKISAIVNDRRAA